MDDEKLLLDSRPVSLKPLARTMVTRLYDEAVLDDTLVERITYRSDGLKVKGYVARPKAEGTYPVLIWNRGGYGLHGSLEDLTAHLILASTARWGYTVLATQYRGNHGGEGTEDWGGDDVNDAYNLLALAAQLPFCDTSRIAVEGASRGGITTYRLLTMYEHFTCAIIHAGVTNVFRLCEARDDFRKLVRKLFGEYSDHRQQELRRRSAVYFADQFPKTAPILLLHGTNDQRVPKEQSLELAAELERLGHPHKLVLIEGGGHVALKDGSYREIDSYRKEWLKKYLG